MLKGKRIVLGISGSIAAYKAASLASLLKRQGADVHVIMTGAACHFIDPVVFDTLTGHRTVTDLFDRGNESPVAHIALGQNSDLIVVAPASADMIAKAANGIADDALSSTLVAASCPVIFSPAMNTVMHESAAVQENLRKLKKYGFSVIEPASGHLACGVTGKGKMPEPEVLFSFIEHAVGYEKDLKGKSVLITAGATREPIDPVRFLSNPSTGKMGCALAKAASDRGADVTLITGNMTAPVPGFVNAVPVVTADEMMRAVRKYSGSSDIIIMAAAVADYKPAKTAKEKIKKSDGVPELKLMPTGDILKYLGEHRKKGQYLCGFAMETEHLSENARKKLEQKKADMIVANDLKEKGAGFGTDTNAVTIITGSYEEKLPLLSKEETAHRILDRITGKKQ